jgi:hypothetical protein
MRRQLFFTAIAGGAVIGGGGLARRYRHDVDAARARLAAVDRTVISTAFGAVEYAERGAGEPVLAIHGIFGGCDQGLLSVGELCPGRRVIAPRDLATSAPPGRPAPHPRTRPTHSPPCSTGSGSPPPM